MWKKNHNSSDGVDACLHWIMKIKSDNFDVKIALQNSLKLKSRIDISFYQRYVIPWNVIGACHFHTNWSRSKNCGSEMQNLFRVGKSWLKCKIQKKLMVFHFQAFFGHFGPYYPSKFLCVRDTFPIAKRRRKNLLWTHTAYRKLYVRFALRRRKCELNLCWLLSARTCDCDDDVNNNNSSNSKRLGYTYMFQFHQKPYGCANRQYHILFRPRALIAHLLAHRNCAQIIMYCVLDSRALFS